MQKEKNRKVEKGFEPEGKSQEFGEEKKEKKRKRKQILQIQALQNQRRQQTQQQPPSQTPLLLLSPLLLQFGINSRKKELRNATETHG